VCEETLIGLEERAAGGGGQQAQQQGPQNACGPILGNPATYGLQATVFTLTQVTGAEWAGLIKKDSRGQLYGLQVTNYVQQSRARRIRDSADAGPSDEVTRSWHLGSPGSEC
jgi:hypothetical protein